MIKRTFGVLLLDFLRVLEEFLRPSLLGVRRLGYVMEEAITGEFSLVKAWKADERGNLVWRGTSRNFNPDCARAGKICIAEVEDNQVEMVPT